MKIWETEIPKDEQGVGRGRWKTDTLMEKLQEGKEESELKQLQRSSELKSN